MNTPLWSGAGQAVQGFTYSPYGGAPARGESSLLPGFNGERPDPINQTYHLGNGYRTYNPALMRFTAPDSWSPFGAGGLNAYAYCEGDPINRTDPSGHMSWQAGVGIGLGVLSILGAIATMGMSIAAEGGVLAAIASADATDLIAGGLGLAADVTGIASIATQESDPEASRILGWVSLGLGIAGVGVDVGNRVYGKLKKTGSYDLLHDTLGQGESREVNTTTQEAAARLGLRLDRSPDKVVQAGQAEFGIRVSETTLNARKAIVVCHGRFQPLQRYLTGTANIDIPEGVRVLHYVRHGQTMTVDSARDIMLRVLPGIQPPSQRAYHGRTFKNYRLGPQEALGAFDLPQRDFDVIRPIGTAHVQDIFDGIRSGALPYDEVHFLFCREVKLTGEGQW